MTQIDQRNRKRDTADSSFYTNDAEKDTIINDDKLQKLNEDSFMTVLSTLCACRGPQTGAGAGEGLESGADVPGGREEGKFEQKFLNAFRNIIAGDDVEELKHVESGAEQM